MPGENQYKMQQKCGLSETYFFMDECCRGGKENSINRRADKIENKKKKQRREYRQYVLHKAESSSYVLQN
jgi:hypothetical protein